MLTGIIGKYKTNLLGKKYLIPNTLKERVKNFKSLPRYCPVMEHHYHDYVGADSHSFSQVSALPQLSSLSELCYPRRAPQSGESSRAAYKGVSVVSHDIAKTLSEDGSSKT